MSICYYLPGLGGSALASSPSGLLSWGSVYAAASTPLSALGLAPDGLTPLAPCGVALSPFSLYGDYYGSAFSGLVSAARNYGVSVVSYIWDWRYALSSIGESLAQQIIRDVSPGIPCSIVAHSAAGLVARAAWLSLGAVGAQDLVRRIVTYGTPHQGSYGAVRLWSLDAASLTSVQYLAAARAVLRAPFPPPQCDPVAQAAIAGTATTWPALYDTLPLVGGSDFAADPLRVLLYEPASWIGPVQPAAAWLSYAATITRPWLLSAASMPPAWVLTTIAGTGTPTAGMLRLGGSIGLPVAYTIGADGDGTVTTSSALVAGAAQITLSCGHNDLPLRLVQDGTLLAAILDPRGPPSPPPAAVVVSGPAVPLLGPPPVPSLGYPAGGGSGMRGC